LITAVGSRAVSVIVFPPDRATILVKSGVRHLSDPDLPRLVQHDGCWDFTDDQKRLQQLEEALK
jgi:hypothetical protein